MKYDSNLKKEIIAMLQENTGRHFLDSGGAYGRHWERNSKLPNTIKYWDSTPSAWLNVYGGKYSEIYGTISLYHFLVRSLSWDEEVTKLNKLWDKFWRADEDTYKSWDKLMDEFHAKYKEKYYFDEKNHLSSFYTYNEENALNQDFIWIKLSDEFCFIQIHGGCDARGGFTVPKIFKWSEENIYDFSRYTIGCSKERDHYWDFDGVRFSYSECEFDWKDIEILDYDNLEESQQKEFDTFGYILAEQEKIYATEGQINLPGVDARLKKPAVPTNCFIVKDKEAFCFCGGKLECWSY